jgi:hypothetical protein
MSDGRGEREDQRGGEEAREERSWHSAPPRREVEEVKKTLGEPGTVVGWPTGVLAVRSSLHAMPTRRGRRIGHRSETPLDKERFVLAVRG